MKKVILCFFFLSLTTVKLVAQDWETDWEQAKEEANQLSKKLVLVFSGSDWCVPCIKLEKEIWSDPVFVKYAQEHYVLFRADFPKRKKNKLTDTVEQLNNNLAQKFNAKGYFPLVVIFDNKGTVLGQLGYEKVSPEAYIDTIESL